VKLVAAEKSEIYPYRCLTACKTSGRILESSKGRSRYLQREELVALVKLTMEPRAISNLPIVAVFECLK
jgi:hypothetical protein